MFAYKILDIALDSLDKKQKAQLLHLEWKGEGSSYSTTVLNPTVKEIGQFLKAGKIDSTALVIMSHRGAVWLFSGICHELHPCRGFATLDPRLGAVVVSSHHKSVPEPGTVLAVPKEVLDKANADADWQYIKV